MKRPAAPPIAVAETPPPSKTEIREVIRSIVGERVFAGRAEFESMPSGCFEGAAVAGLLSPLFMGKGTTMLLGTPGSGKTLMLRLLAQNKHVRIFELNKNGLLNGDIAYVELVADINAPVGRNIFPITDLAGIRGTLADAAKDGQHPDAIIVDDVHYLIHAMQLSAKLGGKLTERSVIAMLELFKAEVERIGARLILVADEGPFDQASRFEDPTMQNRYLRIVEGCTTTADDATLYDRAGFVIYESPPFKVLNLNHRGADDYARFYKGRFSISEAATLSGDGKGIKPKSLSNQDGALTDLINQHHLAFEIDGTYDENHNPTIPGHIHLKERYSYLLASYPLSLERAVRSISVDGVSVIRLSDLDPRKVKIRRNSMEERPSSTLLSFIRQHSENIYIRVERHTEFRGLVAPDQCIAGEFERLGGGTIDLAGELSELGYPTHLPTESVRYVGIDSMNLSELKKANRNFRTNFSLAIGATNVPLFINERLLIRQSSRLVFHITGDVIDQSRLFFLDSKGETYENSPEGLIAPIRQLIVVSKALGGLSLAKLHMSRLRSSLPIKLSLPGTATSDALGFTSEDINKIRDSIERVYLSETRTSWIDKPGRGGANIITDRSLSDDQFHALLIARRMQGE